MGQANRWNRRQWISAAATAVGAAALPSRSWGSLGSMFRNAAAGPVHEAVDTKLKAFPLSQVRLRPGIFLEQLESNQSFIESLPTLCTVHWFLADGWDREGSWKIRFMDPKDQTRRARFPCHP